MALPTYASPLERVWYYTYLVICTLIFIFLIAPILVVMPLSFNAEDFFTFTPGMLAFESEAYSLKHYEAFFTDERWTRAVWNSILMTTLMRYPPNLLLLGHLSQLALPHGDGEAVVAAVHEPGD